MNEEFKVGITGDAFSSRDGIRLYAHGLEYSYTRGRGRAIDQVRAAVLDMITAERQIGREHGRKVAQCFMTPPSQVTAGPNGKGIGPWADGELQVSVRDGSRSGQYYYTVWFR